MKMNLLHCAVGAALLCARRLKEAVPPKTGFLLALLFTLVSFTGFASHFKGGHLSYTYLGGGKYEFLIKGYWDVKEVGSVIPRYQGYPALSGAPVTVSQKLLPDGVTVEHVQKQTVTWSQPGLYEVTWRTCCRGAGSNFDNNSNGLFAAVNYNPNSPSSSPHFSDYPLFKFRTGQAFSHSINAGDPDGHEQEYVLELPYGLPVTAYDAMLSTGFQVDKDGTIRWQNPQEGSWLVNVRVREKIGGNYTGAFVDREIIINVSSSDGSEAPVFINTPGKTIREGQQLSFEVEASDSPGQVVKLTAYGAAFDKGATFTQTVTGNPAKGAFSWTPARGTAGNYLVQFVATDNQQPAQSAVANVPVVVEPCRVLPTYTIVAKPCGSDNSGRLTLSASEGVAPYAYSINNGATFQSNASFSNLAAGSYTVVVKDAIGCLSQPMQVTLAANPLPVVTLSLPAAVCSNAGSFTLTGGSPAGGVYSGPGVANGVFDPTQAGIGTHTLYYTYTDGNGCTNTASANIAVNEVPVASAGPDKEIVKGAGQQVCTTLTANATGGKLPYTYRWSTGETTQSISVCPAETTTYTVTVTDANGCANTSQVKVTVVTQGSSPTAPGSGNEPPKGNPDNPGQPTNPGPPSSPGGPGKPGGAISASTASNVLALGVTQPAIFLYPNPLVHTSELQVTITQREVVVVEIIGLTGKVVKTLYNGEVLAGQTLSFNIDKTIGRSGIYLVRVATSGGVKQVKLLVQ